MHDRRVTAAMAIAASGPSALACGRFLCVNPVTFALSFLAAVIVGTSAGPLAAALAIATAGLLLLAACPLPVTRRLVGPALTRKQRRDRNERRERRLERAGSARRTELDELTGLVEEIADWDPDECARLELEELVDLYVDMAVVVESYRGAARRCAAPVAAREREGRGGPCASERLRRDLVRRRLAHRDECARRAEELESELDAVVEFVRLVAQRAACPTGEELIEPQLVRRLWELDVCDTALRQLGGEEAASAADQ